jgi:outer membrane protein assembly factor BamB
MEGRKTDTKEDREFILPGSTETKRKRGLSRLLQKPLSGEPSPEEDMEEEAEEQDTDTDAEAIEPEVLEERLSGMGAPLQASSDTTSPHKSAPATRSVSSSRVPDTRQVSQVKKESPVQKEGLLSEGIQLQSRYKILGVVGVGGMGAVYKAQDLRFPSVTRLCAVKEMINAATNPKHRKMIVRNFEREASILATLSHPAIPQVQDFFTEGTRSYLVMEFVRGYDLETHIGRIEGFLPEAQVVDWAVQLCDVLSYLHNHKPQPIIFRDLKPANIMLDAHDRVRLVDFGIAKIFQSGEKGTTIGTEGYSPPEQYRGGAEPRGDIYALGATLHHLLSKQDPRMEPPFSFHERPIYDNNPTVSRELVEIIDKALEYDVNKRWGSAEEMKRALLSLSSARGLGGPGRGETASFSTSAGVQPLWRFACEDEVRGTVAVSDGVIYVPCYDNNVYAINAEDGSFLWKHPTEGGIASTPWVSEDMVVFGSTDKTVYAVEEASGRLIWSVPTQGRIFSSAYGEFGHIFIGSDDHNLYAIHQLSGREAWTHAVEGEVRSRPLVKDNLIIFSCYMGVVYALGLNREVRWRFRARRGILSSPLLSHGLIFVGSLDWHLYALDVRSGWKVWHYRTGGAVVSSAVVGEDLVFFGSVDGYFYALDAEDGRLVWRYQIEEQITASADVYNGKVYFGGVDGALYCLDARSGSLHWRYETDSAITGAPVIVDNVLYIGSSDHYVYAIPV